ncbi:MAG: response regulator [Proteobacteria bacterium]|nr:response regulator [Pseudomonadota bacterium]MBU1640681.1 response regulator [Pseudomonadota bacterium]
MKKILIIDDEPLVRNVLKTMLEKAGYEVKEASNGDDGIHLFHTFSPQLIITDIVMPVKNGIEVIMEIRETNPTVKFIAISGGGYVPADKYLTLAKALDVSICMLKPLDFQELIAAVKNLIGT